MAEVNKSRTVQIIPAKPFYHVPIEEFITLLCMVPAGKITRYEDIEAYLKKLHSADDIMFDHTPFAYHPDIPLWRLVSTRGMLMDIRLGCSREYQKVLLEQEGLKIIPCGANNRSLKVENYKDYLFDFNTLSQSIPEKKEDIMLTIQDIERLLTLPDEEAIVKAVSQLSEQDTKAALIEILSNAEWSEKLQQASLNLETTQKNQ